MTDDTVQVPKPPAGFRYALVKGIDEPSLYSLKLHEPYAALNVFVRAVMEENYPEWVFADTDMEWDGRGATIGTAVIYTWVYNMGDASAVVRVNENKLLPKPREPRIGDEWILHAAKDAVISAMRRVAMAEYDAENKNLEPSH